jgi:cell division protein FtsX
MSQFFWNNTRSLLSSSRKKFLAVACIISFLLFFINILVLLRYNTEIVAQELQSQLGIYLYVKEGTTGSDSQQKLADFQKLVQEQQL